MTSQLIVLAADGSAPTITTPVIPTGLVASVAGKTGVISLVKGDVGLGNVDNTSDATKVSSGPIADALATKATPASVAAAVAALVNSSPSTLDTLKELADALGDDPNFATTIATALAGKPPKPGSGLHGKPLQWDNTAGAFVDDTARENATYAAVLKPTAVKAANYLAVAGELVPFDLTAASRTLTLPTAPADRAQVFGYIQAFGTGNTLTITAGGSDVIESSTGTSASITRSAGAGQSAWLRYDAANQLWRQLPDRLPLTVLDARYAAASDLTSETARATGAESANATNVSANTTAIAALPTRLFKAAGTWPARPSAPISVEWIGPSPGPTIGGAGNAVDGYDTWIDTA